jgi:succinylglutamic semialdehyde dehydrogenase
MAGTDIISIEPATGKEFWRGTTSNVDDEVTAARQSRHEWAARPVAFRVETVRRFVNVVRTHFDTLADSIARETGKPLWEARNEVESVIAKVELSVKAYSERTSQRRLEGALGQKSSLRHKPHGVMAVLGPYNFPAHLPNGHIIPALIAGNAVVFKPSEKTPATGALMVKLYREAGVPDGVIRLVIGGPEEGKALAAHAGIDGLLFTGSARTGVSLNRQFADTPGRILALEMGGNNPIVVWDAPDISTAAIIVAQSAFLTAGQRCTAARRLIVRDGLHEELCSELVKIANRLIVDAPHSTPAPFMGPVIDNETADGLEESFVALMMRGGRPVKNIERPFKTLPFLSPSIIDVTDVKDRPDIELFGPILQMVRVADFASAISEANATRYGLCASLIGGSPELYDEFWANVNAGLINWNKPTNGAPSAGPFGGLGLSGNHRPTAFYAADYCAYPVVSTEEENARASIGIGLREVTAASLTS